MLEKRESWYDEGCCDFITIIRDKCSSGMATFRCEDSACITPDRRPTWEKLRAKTFGIYRASYSWTRYLSIRLHTAIISESWKYLVHSDISNIYVLILTTTFFLVEARYREHDVLRYFKCQPVPYPPEFSSNFLSLIPYVMGGKTIEGMDLSTWSPEKLLTTAEMQMIKLKTTRSKCTADEWKRSARLDLLFIDRKVEMIVLEIPGSSSKIQIATLKAKEWWNTNSKFMSELE